MAGEQTYLVVFEGGGKKIPNHLENEQHAVRLMQCAWVFTDYHGFYDEMTLRDTLLSKVNADTTRIAVVNTTSSVFALHRPETLLAAIPVRKRH